jgi:LuxR family maltose regulon positive regulatory protein
MQAHRLSERPALRGRRLRPNGTSFRERRPEEIVMQESKEGGVVRPGRPRRATSTALVVAAPTPLPLPLIESKLHPPPRRDGTISRRALVEQIEARSGTTVVTVVAPAGYGKTTLLTEWAELDARSFAWITLDAHDGQPAPLLGYLACALDRIEPVDRRVFDALSRPGPALWKIVLPLLGAALSSRKHPVVIVVDNAHLVRDRRTLTVLAGLIEHLPPRSTIVLAGRAAPALPLARLRAQGRLAEVGTDDLRLTDREAYSVLRRADVRISEADARELAGRAEGWPAGLYLAALALRRRNLTPELVREFSGADRFVTDYLRLELLADLPPATVEFLTRISVLDHLSGPVCDAILGCSGCARALESVERSNLLLVPLDHQRREYRFHHFFRDLLRAELERREPALVPVLHRRAAEWYEAHGDPGRVIEHAVAGGELARAATLAAGLAQNHIDAGDLDGVEQWLVLLDAHGVVEGDAALAVLFAWVHALRARTEEAAHWAWVAEKAPTAGALPDGTASIEPWLAMLRAGTCRRGGERMVADAEAAVEGLAPASTLRPGALLLLAVARLLAGEPDEADRLFAEAAEAATTAGSSVVACIALAQRSLRAGVANDPESAAALAAQAEAIVRAAGLEGYGAMAIVDAASARVAAAHGDARAAERSLAHAQGVRPLLGTALPWLAVQARLELAQAHIAIADFGGAKTLLAEIDALLRQDGEAAVDDGAILELRRQISAGGEHAQAWASTLTAAELRLLPLLTTYLTFKEIAERLFVSRNTAKTQAISVYRKLGVSSRSEAIERAVELGLVEPSAVPSPQLVTLSG